MFTLTLTFDYNDVYDFRDYLLNNSWGGAKNWIKEWELEDFQRLLDYLDGCEASLEQVELNDFIWFEWDDVKKEMDEENMED